MIRDTALDRTAKESNSTSVAHGLVAKQDEIDHEGRGAAKEDDDGMDAALASHERKRVP